MNKFYNALLFLIFIPTMIISIVVGFDTPVTLLRTSGANIPYNREALIALGLFILYIGIRRSTRRWVAMRLVNKTEKYKFNTVVTADRVKRVYVYNFLEAFIFICAGIGLYALTERAWMPALAFLLSAIDEIVHVIYGATQKKFRVGLTTKALLAGDRDVAIIYFKGLRKVSVQQQTIFFDFKEELQLRFPIDLIPEEKREEFFTELKACTDETKVYFQNNI